MKATMAAITIVAERHDQNSSLLAMDWRLIVIRNSQKKKLRASLSLYQSLSFMV